MELSANRNSTGNKIMSKSIIARSCHHTVILLLGLFVLSAASGLLPKNWSSLYERMTDSRVYF